MSWNGQVPTNASWQGNPQFAGDEVLYITPDPPTTATNPSIGIVDGNEIPLPTAYNTFNVATLGATTLNSTTINNSGTITTATLGATTGNVTTLNSTTINNSGTITTDNITANTINGDAPTDLAYLWSTFDALHDVRAQGQAVTPYVPRQVYGPNTFPFLLPSLASFGNPYQNYVALETGGSINPANTLDAWNSATFYNPSILPIWGATYNGIQYLAVNAGDNDPPPSANWRLANYDNTYNYSTGSLAYLPTTKTWYQRTTAGSGNPPPNASFWNVYTFWAIYQNSLFPAFDLLGWREVQSSSVLTGTVDTVDVNAEGNVNAENVNVNDTANVLKTVNIGTITSGGTLNVGTAMVNPVSYPDVNIGNSTVGRAVVTIHGSKNLTGFSSLICRGGATFDGGAVTGTNFHGVDFLYGSPTGITPTITSTVKFRLNPVPVDLFSIEGTTLLPNQAIAFNATTARITLNAGTELVTRSLLGTEIESGTGVYVSGLTLGDYNGGRMFIQHICPAYLGDVGGTPSTTVLLIDGKNDVASGNTTGVQIDDGTTWTTQNLTVTNISAPAATTLEISSAVNLDLGATTDINLLAGDDIDVQATGDLTLNSSTAGSTLSALGGVDITSTTGSVSIASGIDISLNPTGVIDLNNKNITEANTITAAGNLNLSSTGGGNGVTLTSDVAGYVTSNGNFNMAGNNIVNASTITGANVNVTIATIGNNNINLSPAGTGTIIATKNLNMSNNNIVNANMITGQGALTLASASNGDINLSPNGTGTIVASKALNMGTNAISGVTTLNGRNLFSYGNFFNSASQTLTATNTATRVKMDTSLNNNLITLDTSTNIGRITFTNAGVYNVVWNAYLFHGTGGTTETRIWIRLNGTDVAGSGKTEDNDSQQNETNMTSSSLVSVTASQYIEFYWAADSVNVPLTAVAASAPYPATPSFSCTISIVG